eukprot:362062_1
MTLKKDVRKINDSVDSLKQNTDELNETMKQFDDLKNELAKHCGDDGDMKEISDTVEDLNSSYSTMQTIILNNEKASLLPIYYKVELKDDTKGLSQTEYTQFLARISKEQRKRFKEFGTFEEISGDDGVIDLHEFQALIEQILSNYEEVLVQQTDKK